MNTIPELRAEYDKLTTDNRQAQQDLRVAGLKQIQIKFSIFKQQIEAAYPGIEIIQKQAVAEIEPDKAITFAENVIKNLAEQGTTPTQIWIDTARMKITLVM
jgi:hypothetical protein